MRLRGKSGEAVMLLLMGAMIVGGIIVWLATGDFHMMPTHGNRDSHMNADAGSSSHDTRTGSPNPAPNSQDVHPEPAAGAPPVPDSP